MIIPSLGMSQTADSSRVPVKGKLYISAFPIISYNPTFGVFVGAAGSAGMYLGDPKTTRMSNGTSTATYTQKNQLLFTFKTNVYTPEDKWFLIGDWRVFFSSQPTFGLGTGPQANLLYSDGELIVTTPDGGIPREEMLKFDLIRFHETAFIQVKPNVYVGLGYHLDAHRNIVDQVLDLESDPQVLTNHFVYSYNNGFNPERYTTSAVSLNFMYDSRDNIANAYTGLFLLASARMVSELIGSDQDAVLLSLEARKFFSLSERNPRHVLAYWGYAHTNSSGKLPYMSLPALGWDQMGKSGRGYAQGRYRGNALFYSELEYRYPIKLLKNHPDLMGGTVFCNVTSASNTASGVRVFDYLKPAGGVGLRFMIKKEARANLSLDYSVGVDGSDGFYISINETF